MNTNRQTSPHAVWACAAALPAVVAAYPLLEALRTCRTQAMSSEPGYGRAPFNVIAHSEKQWTDRDRDIVTPANDLLYSNAWLDLRNGPVIIDIPRATRFFVVELLDVYTNNFLNLGTRNVPAEGGRFALLSPGADESTVPAGVVAVRCPTSLVWVLARVLVEGADDLAAARDMQAGICITGPAVAAPPNSLTAWQESGDAALDFFANLGRALHDFPPLDGQKDPFEMLAGAHIRLPADGNLAGLRGATIEGLREAHAAAMALIEGHTRSPSKAPWRYSTRLGKFGNDYMLRAATAWKGIAALSADEAIYAATDFDQQGEALHGSNLYRIRFKDGGAVPAGAFWSISLYGQDRYFVPNPIGRHALGNRSMLERDADGALTLYVSQATPQGPESNWLPAPDGPFYLILRVYHPQESLLNGTYQLPPVERVDE